MARRQAHIPRRTNEPQINLNLNVRGLGLSATLAINERSAQLRAEGRPVFRMGLGQSPFPVPPSVVKALQENAHQKDYLPVRGLPELREAVAAHHGQRHGLQRTGADVLVGPGSKELMFLLQLVYYGDLVIPTPSWVSYAPQAHILGRRVHWVPTSSEHEWRLMPDELDRLASEDPGRPRIVILNYPSNPTGGTYRLDRLKELAAVARRHRIILLSDEIYGELHHTGQHVSAARFYPEGTIVSSGLSKWCGAGGWRLGTFTFPPSLRWLLDAMAVAASETFTSTSAPIQYAAVRAFQGGEDIESYLSLSRSILRALGKHAATALSDAGAQVQQPKGAFYLFPDFTPMHDRLERRGITSGRELCERLLTETGVAALPGSCFGRADEELTLRIAYVDFDGAAALREAAAVAAPLGEDFLTAWCAPTVEAVRRMVGWATL